MLQPISNSQLRQRPAKQLRGTPTDESPLQSSQPPAGFSAVDSVDGSMLPKGPSLLRARLQNNKINLIAIRHGESQANAESAALGQPILYGQSESPLTDKGRLQAKNCALELYNQLGGDSWIQECLNDSSQLPVFISSSTSRATESAQVIVDHLKEKIGQIGGEEALARLGPQLVVESDSRLRETNFGRFEKRPLSELQQAYPEFVSHWRPSEGLGTDFLHKFPGGESRADVMNRIGCSLDGVCHKYPGRTVIMMSHGESILATRTTLGLVPVQDGKVRAETGVINNATPYWLVGQAPVSATPCTEGCPAYEL
jgi:broad specificity phosphatase PhoE